MTNKKLNLGSFHMYFCSKIDLICTVHTRGFMKCVFNKKFLSPNKGRLKKKHVKWVKVPNWGGGGSRQLPNLLTEIFLLL